MGLEGGVGTGRGGVGNGGRIVAKRGSICCVSTPNMCCRLPERIYHMEGRVPVRKLTSRDPETHSADIVADNVKHLKILFPEAFTGGKVNFNVLQLLLGVTVDESEERYGLNWHGKRRAQQLALTPSTGTLRPCPEESVDWNSTQNLMIEGDNLEVLKLLQKSYAGKVSLIYIDPPYNTGKDFIYTDNYRDSIQNYLAMTGQVDDNNGRLSSNTEVSGRFHTNWLNMMYPRLKLARNLLREGGVIFISVDDREAANLRKLCGEIFGEENFIAQFVWNTEGHTDNQFDVKINHEYVLLFAKNSHSTRLGHVVDPNTRQESNLWKGYAENSITKNGPANPPGEVELPVGFPCACEFLDLPASDVPNEFFQAVGEQGHITRDLTKRYQVEYPIRLDPMQVERGYLTNPCRVFSGWANVNKLNRFIQNNCDALEDGNDTVSFYISKKGVIYYRRDREKARNILSVLRKMGTTERMRSELEQLGIPYQYPKPKDLIRYLVQIGAESGGIVLDFFAGSGTLGHAVVLQNVADGRDRRFVLVQLPEPLDDGSGDQRNAAQFCRNLGQSANLAEITKERLRRSFSQVRENNPSFSGDLGFRVFKLDSSNIHEWAPDPNDLEGTLLSNINNIKFDRDEEDILYELLLKLGLDLCVPIETRSIAGKPVRSIGTGTLIACLGEKITREDVEPLALGIVEWHQEIAATDESAVVFRDSAFEDDVAKTNCAAILQQCGLKNVRSL